MSNRITRFYIDKFKSLSEFDLPMPESAENNFICLIGKNGAGKSTILQAIDFVGQIFRGNITAWLKSRNWKRTDILEKPTIRTINITIEGTFDNQFVEWKGIFNVLNMNCTHESIQIDGQKAFTKNEKQFIFYKTDGEKNEVYDGIFAYEGSFLALLNKKILEKYNVNTFVSFMKSVFSFDTLNSKQLRAYSRTNDDYPNIGSGGEKLAGRFYNFSQEEKNFIIDTVKDFYPWLYSAQANTKKGGWIGMRFFEKDTQATKKLNTLIPENESITLLRGITSQHSCDGLLRLFAIVTELATSDSFIVFDEIENGFHPEIMKKLIQLFIKSKKQILITTHNPVLLNYIEDDIAKESVVLVYKAEPFKSKAIRFFDIPEAKERLQYLGAGEAFLDIDFDDMIENMRVAK